MPEQPDIVILVTDEERAVPPYESADVLAWRRRALGGRRWFDEHGVSFARHYTGSLACVPSRPTMFTGQYPDLHGVTQTDGIGKRYDDSRLRWLRPGEVPTLGNWFRAAGYDTHYDGKWHISHADLDDPETGEPLATNDEEGVVDQAAVQRYLEADPLGPYGFSGWVGPEPHGAAMSNSGFRRDPLFADRVVVWLNDRYERRRAGDVDALRPFLLVASFVNPHDIVLFPAWSRRNPLTPSPSMDPPHVPAPPTADEDLRTKPAAQIAFREAYYSGYGPAPAIGRSYKRNAQQYRACTPKSTNHSIGCGARSPTADPRTPSWFARRTTETSSAPTVDFIRSGSTCTTRRPAYRSSSLASARVRRGHVSSRRRRHTSTWCRHCSAPRVSTSTSSRMRSRSRSPRCIRFLATT
jgi:arylsulfatase A-like enzyme